MAAAQDAPRGIEIPADLREFPDRCWRCGVPFAETTLEDLAACQSLARGETGAA